MFRLLVACVGVATAMNTSNTLMCSVNGAAGGQVVKFSDGKYQRCMSLITPSSAKKPMPILWWFHGSGGNAAHCGSSPMVKLAESSGFAFICGEAAQDVFGHGGQWNIPAKITDTTGTPCSDSDSVEVGYMKNALAHLAKSPETYDTSRVFTSGCSMGSAFSGYIGNCLKKWEPQQISAFATHSTGLKQKGDGLRLPENWGECDGCQWWPFAPVKYTDSLGLKACIFDNTGDGDFYQTSEFLAKEWPKLGNPSESHFASGGHCQNIPHADIVKCLGIAGSSPRPPTPGPSPTPPSPTPPAPTPPSPTPPAPTPPSPPSPDQPPAACQKCFMDHCPNLHKTASEACQNCVKQNQGTCTSSCAPFPFPKAESWFCGGSEIQLV
jgi:hypothetical protein